MPVLGESTRVENGDFKLTTNAESLIRRFPRRFLVIPVFVLFFTSLVMAAEFTDSDGRTVRFSRPFSRIISLYAAHTQNLKALGLSDREVVAVSPGVSLFPGVPRMSFRSDVERFLALSPDLVLIRPMISRACPGLVRRLQESGVAVVSLQPRSVDEMFRYWRQLGLLAGRERQAESIIDGFEKKIEWFRKEADAIPFGRRKRVYFEAIHSRMKTFAPSSIAAFVLETAGGINIAADAQRVRNTNIAFYGKERLLAKASQIDVYLAQKGRMNPVTIKEIMETPGYEAIKAVQQGEVYLVDESIVSRPVPGLLRGIQAVHDILYGKRQGAEDD